jgi:hypothetical protein
MPKASKLEKAVIAESGFPPFLERLFSDENVPLLE